MNEQVPELMRRCRSYFPAACYEGPIRAEGGRLQVPEVETEWVAVEGIGVFAKDEAPDLQLEGVLWELRPPQAFLRLCEDAAALEQLRLQPEEEHFGDYGRKLSLAKAEASLRSRIARWQRMFAEVDV